MADTEQIRRRNWRSLNDLYACKKKLIWNYQNLIVQATQKFQLLDDSMRNQRKLNVESIKCLLNTKKLLESESDNFFQMNEEHGELRNTLNTLVEDISKTNQTANDVKLQLEKLKHRVRLQAAITNELSLTLGNVKIFNKKLEERYEQYKNGNIDLKQVYESRALMFINKLFLYSHEHLTITVRKQKVCNASDYLKWKNNQLQLEQSVLMKRLAKHADQNKSYDKFILTLISKFERVMELMTFLWNCISRLSECPKVLSPHIKCRSNLT